MLTDIQNYFPDTLSRKFAVKRITDSTVTPNATYTTF